MNILNKITAHKRKILAERKILIPTKLLEGSSYFNSEPVSLKYSIDINPMPGIIAEFKRKSPSKGIINKDADIIEISKGYMKAGATALSVLTDTYYFMGKNDDLTAARKHNDCPILRKDFTIDEYQVIEAKSIGADAILLIAAILTRDEIKKFTDLAHSLNLEVLLEIHDAGELIKMYDEVDLVGINNRNLKTFKVSLDHSVELSRKLPSGIIKIAESGISDPASIIKLHACGFKGFLIGESFMRAASPALECRKYIEFIRKGYETEQI